TSCRSTNPPFLPPTAGNRTGGSSRKGEPRSRDRPGRRRQAVPPNTLAHSPGLSPLFSSLRDCPHPTLPLGGGQGGGSDSRNPFAPCRQTMLGSEGRRRPRRTRSLAKCPASKPS